LAGVGVPVESGPDFMVHPVLEALCPPDACPKLPKSLWPVGQKGRLGPLNGSAPSSCDECAGIPHGERGKGVACGTDASLREGTT
jgi:hypothetical protein